MTAGIRYEFAFGTYEDALRMVGVRSEPRFARTAVSASRIQHFASMVQDGNPSYWDAEFATDVWGGLVAPPALLIFGTRHPGYFNAGQGTELLSFLARVIEHCLRLWLGLKA